MSEKKKKGFVDFRLLRKVISLAKPFRKQFNLAIALAIFLAVIGPARPWLAQIAVDRYILEFNLNGLINICILMIMLLVAESILKYFFIMLSRWVGNSVVNLLRVKVFDHLLHLRLKYFDRTPIGTSTTRTINDVEAINEVFSEGIITMIADLLTILVIIVAMALMDWRLTLVSLSVFPILIYATYIFKEGIKRSFQEVRNQVAALNAFLQEHITGMRVVQIFNSEKRELEKFKIINAAHRKANIQSIWYFSLFFPIVEIVSALAIGLMVWWGANAVMKDFTTIGTLTGFILYLTMLFRPLRVLADKFNTLQMGVVAADRVFELLDRKEFISNDGILEAKNISGDVKFENVWFAYDQENYVLRNVSLHIESGKTLAIVGATGAGKSSVINLLSRFYEINQGKIFIDKKDIREYDLHSLRSTISVVMQDVFLFSGSILDNIRLRNENISRDSIINAAKMIGAHEFIMRLPNGYDFNVMERGGTLSQGQRQIISFIRALVFNPSILVLDEATSSIDTESEQLIQHAIETLIEGRTSIVIAHRLSTIQKADKIIVLDKGELKESGTHDELISKNGLYKQLYDLQFKKEEAA